MAEYKGIKGFKVQSLASDPGASSATEGQVWYNTTGNALKLMANVGVWSSGGDMNTARKEQNNGGFGTQTAAMTAGGSNPAPFTVNAETYNGSAWTEVNNLSTGRAFIAGFGSSQDSGLMVGGFAPWPTIHDLSETWNGTSWTEGNNLNTARAGMSEGGTATAGFVAGGAAPATPSSILDATEEYNGTSWVTGNALPEGRYISGGGGTQIAGLCIGGKSPPGAATDTTFEYDGTNWSTNPATLNTAKDYGLSFGSQTDAIFFAGSPSTVNTEAFDGSAWTEVNNLATARHSCGTLDGGSGPAGLAIGNTPITPSGTIVEEWTRAATVQTVTTT